MTVGTTWSHEALVRVAVRWLRRDCVVVLSECGRTNVWEIPDALGFGAFRGDVEVASVFATLRHDWRGLTRWHHPHGDAPACQVHRLDRETWACRRGCPFGGRTCDWYSIPATRPAPTNHTVLVECKASRADFVADRKKSCRADPAGGLGRLRYYLTPPGVAKRADVPEGWGLLHAVTPDGTTYRRPRTVKAAPVNDLHNVEAELALVVGWGRIVEMVLSNRAGQVWRTGWKGRLLDRMVAALPALRGRMLGRDEWGRRHWPGRNGDG